MLITATNLNSFVLSSDFLPVPGLSATLTTLEPSILRVYGHLGIQIQNDEGGFDDKYLIALKIQCNGNWIYQASENVRRDQHYIDWPFFASKVVAPGDHDVSIWVRAHPKNARPETIVHMKDPQYTRVHFEL